MTKTKVEQVAQAVREEIVRQYRDFERSKCPGGDAYYEEHIMPEKIARVAIAAMREPTDKMVCAALDASDKGQNSYSDLWRAMIDEVLK